MNKFKDFENSVLKQIYSNDITDENGVKLGETEVMI